jgi:4-amino-4-deoxy-L-arabinose transferase-like glycosyltransferase
VRALLIAALLFAGCSFLTTRSTLWDRDEPRFAVAALEMARSGQWLYPTFNGELRPDKPILIYWLMSASIRILGPGEWSVRFISTLAAALAAWLTFVIGARVLTPGTARGAMVVLATTPLFVIEGTAATADAVLLAAITGALACFASSLLSAGRERSAVEPDGGAVREGWRLRHLVLLALALALAQLAKGPIGLAIPLLSVLTALWLARRSTGLDRRYRLGAVLAALASVALFCAWAVPANIATGGRYASEGLGAHVLRRAVQPLEGHGGPYLPGLLYHVPVVLAGFAPWTLFLPAAISALLGGRIGGEKGRALFLGWIAATFVLVSLIATKLPHYVLPIFPPLALSVAWTVAAARDGRLAARDRAWLGVGSWLLALVAAALLATLAWGARAEPALRGGAAALGAVVLCSTAAALVLSARRRWMGCAASLCAGSLGCGAVLAFLLLPALEARKFVPRLAAGIRAHASADERLATFGFDEPSLHFHLPLRAIERLADPEEVAAWCAVPRPGVLVTPRERRRELDERIGPLGLTEIASARGLNYPTGRTQEIVALAVAGGPGSGAESMRVP